MKVNPSLLKSAGLHIVLLCLLFVSVDFKAEPTIVPASNAPIIQATFIDAQAIADKKREEEQKVADQKRIKDAERAKLRKAKELKAKRAAQAKAKKAADAKRKKDAERQQALKQQAAEEVKRKRELAEKQKREAQKKADDERKQAQLDKLLQEQLASERKEQRARRSREIGNEVDRYRAEINGRIQRHIIDDPSFKGKTCRLNIRLASTGLVIKVSVLDGDPALCRVAENAVVREETLPVSDDPDVYEELKNINLTVKL